MVEQLKVRRTAPAPMSKSLPLPLSPPSLPSTPVSVSAVAEQSPSAGPGGFPIPMVMQVLHIDCSLSEIARGTGMTLGHISRIMSGQRMPSLNVASQIAVYLGISVDRFTAAILEVRTRTGK